MPKLIEVRDTSRIILKEDTDYKIIKHFISETKEIDVDDRTVTHLITTNDRDRYGDIIEPKGAELEMFIKNNVVLSGHSYGELPIATNVWLKIVKNGILAKTRFHNKTQMAIDTFELVKEGVLKAWSIGFIPKVWETFEEEGIRGYLYKIWELLEYSLVSVPANPYALNLAYDKGMLIDPLWEKIIERCGVPENQGSLIDAKQLSALEKRIDDFEGRIKNIEDSSAAFESNAVEEANKKANESLEIIVNRIPEIVSDSIGGVVRRITGQKSKEN